MTVSAAVRFIPRPPALTNTHLSFLLTIHCISFQFSVLQYQKTEKLYLIVVSVFQFFFGSKKTFSNKVQRLRACRYLKPSVISLVERRKTNMSCLVWKSATISRRSEQDWLVIGKDLLPLSWKIIRFCWNGGNCL